MSKSDSLFLEELGKISKIFKPLIREKNIKIIHHLDADGISSASMIARMLIRENANFEMRMVKQLTSDVINSLNISEKDLLIFLDMGSGQLKLLKSIIEMTQVLILDHHEFAEMEHPNLFHLNPLTFAEENLSSSMICYLFAKSVNLRNVDLIDLAIVGAVGDEIEASWEFKGMAKKILEEAENVGKVTVSKGIRLYGRSTRPIHKTLELSFDPFIPDISGSESNAVQFLSELGIKMKEDERWRRLVDLSVEEQQKIASAIIIERLKAKHSNAEEIFGEIYTILGRPEELQDTREFATLLNACGRLQKPEIGIRLCLNDLTALDASKEILLEYKKLISDGISWIRENKESIQKTDFATYIFCGDKIPSTMIGTITSIFLNSNLVDTGKPVLGFADDNGKVKISARVSKDININLRDVILNATREMEGEGGGHKRAAGALIEKGKEKEFAELIDKTIGELVGNQKI